MGNKAYYIVRGKSCFFFLENVTKKMSDAKLKKKGQSAKKPTGKQVEDKEKTLDVK